MQLNFADKPVDACALVFLDKEVRGKEVQVEHLLLPLEVPVVVPFFHCVFQLADSAHIAKYFLDAVHADRNQVIVFGVGDAGSSGRGCHVAVEPLNRLDINQSLEAEEVNSNLDGVLRADLGDRLHIGSV